MKITEEWKILIENPEGDIVEVIDICEYDFDKQLARGDVMNTIQEVVERGLKKD